MIDFLTTLSGIGGLIAFVVFCIFIPWCLSGDEDRQNAIAAIAWLIIGAVATMVLIGEVPDWRAILIGIPVYFSIGVLWFMWRWRSLILRKRDESRENWRKTMERRKPEGRQTYADWGVGEQDKPQASRYKERIAGWIVLWPWGVLWTVLRWPWKLAVKIADWAHGIADRMVDRLWQP